MLPYKRTIRKIIRLVFAQNSAEGGFGRIQFQGTVPVTDQPHKLIYVGSTPTPETNMDLWSNVRATGCNPVGVG